MNGGVHPVILVYTNIYVSVSDVLVHVCLSAEEYNGPGWYFHSME